MASLCLLVFQAPERWPMQARFWAWVGNIYRNVPHRQESSPLPSGSRHPTPLTSSTAALGPQEPFS